MALDIGSLFRFGARRRGNAAGTALTPDFRPQNPEAVLTVPVYRDHLRDLYTERTSSTNSLSLLELLFRSDPDVSATVNAYLTVADTEYTLTIKNAQGEYDLEAYRSFEAFKSLLAFQADLGTGFQMRVGLRALAERLRHLALLRGACAAELIVDRRGIPSEVRIIDPQSIRWYQTAPGVYKPRQRVSGQTEETPLDIPTFFFSWFRPNPIGIYPQPPFAAAINTIAARQQVINDLYRIMNVTGYPRISVKVLEQVLRNSAPASIQNNKDQMIGWVNDRMAEIRATFSDLRPDQAFVHTDATEPKVITERSSAVGLQVESIISVLNAQNQAGLKTVSTILGRGESGVNTASVESRVFSMNADALNTPVAEILSRIITVALQLAGHPVIAELNFRPSELRPATELENHMMVRQSRLLQALSLGVITDEEFHVQMYGRPPQPGAPMLSGTRFLENNPEVPNQDGNTDSQGRALTPEGQNGSRSNTVPRRG